MLSASQQEARFARVVGFRFLSFTVAATVSELEARLEGSKTLTRAQEDVLGQVLAAAAQSAVTASQTGGGGETDFLFPLLDYDESTGMSRPNVLRRAAGGSIPPIRARDGAERELARLARDLYPTFLLEPSAPPSAAPRWIRRTWQMSPVAYRHPAAAAFETAIETDPIVNQLFADRTPESGRIGFFWTSLGGGRSIQLSMLAHDLLGAAHRKLTLADAFDQTTFVNAAVEQLRLVRRLVAGESVDVQCTVAFVGAESRGNPLETPWGILRSPTRGETELRADSPVAHSQEIVLSFEMPMAIDIERDPHAVRGIPPANPLAGQTQGMFRNIEQRAQLLALTLLLGLDRQPPVAIARTWTLIDNPLSQGPSLSWFQNAIPLNPHLLETRDRSRIRTWATRINGHYSDRIEIAVRRTLAALTTRPDPTDKLIDAVVALENLFGTGSGELAFRISAGCACLLERNSDRRLEVQKDVARLYTVRSKIVHGAHAPTPANVDPDATAAARYAMLTLRYLFARRRDLIDDKDRARRLIFGR